MWFTILSVFAWILNCDLGIGHGVRNKLVATMKSMVGREYNSCKLYVLPHYFIFSYLIV